MLKTNTHKREGESDTNGGPEKQGKRERVNYVRTN